MNAEIRWLLAFHRVMCRVRPIAALVQRAWDAGQDFAQMEYNRGRAEGWEAFRRDVYREGLRAGFALAESHLALGASERLRPIRPVREVPEPHDPEEQHPCVVCEKPVTFARSEIERMHRFGEDKAHRKEMWRAHCCARHGHPFQRQQKGASA